MPELKLIVKLSRKIAGSEVEFGVEQIVKVENAVERRAAYEVLTNMLNDQFSVFVETNRDMINAAADRADGSSEVIACKKLVVEINKGKKYYAIIGGQYEKFGVRVWREVLEDTDLLDRLGDNLELDLQGYKAIIVAGDKGKKVSRIIAAKE